MRYYLIMPPLNYVQVNHVLKSRDGVPDPANLADGCLDGAIASNLPIVIWYHGGLVDTKAGLALADDLGPRYLAAGSAYPIYHVWESGPGNALPDALLALLKRALSKGILGVLEKYVNARFGIGGVPFAMRGAALDRVPDAIPADHQEALIEAFRLDANLRAEARYLSGERGMKLAAVSEDDAGPKAKDLDERIRALAQAGDDPEVKFTRDQAMALDLATWKFIATVGIKVAWRVIRRHAQDRDHGVKETIIEELAREFVLRGEVWNDMKQDTLAGFANAERVGNKFIQALKARSAQLAGRELYLVGHSTGAIYIAHFLDAARASGLNLKFKIRLLAPASRCDLTGPNLIANAAMVQDCRIYALTTGNEESEMLLDIPQIPAMLRNFYKGSLLRMVCGGLEPEGDVPLVGMRRFIGKEVGLTAAESNAVDQVLSGTGGIGSFVWASTARRHGDFDEWSTGVPEALLG